MPDEHDPHELLESLGLNRLEAEVYLFLLPNPPQTAYRIGKHLNRPTANVYKAVESLARKGAVLLEEGENRLCRAVPAVDFCRQLERGYAANARRAESVLSRMQADPAEEKVYHIESAEQLFDRARLMLEERAVSIAVIDAFPAALRAILPSVRTAIDRGVRVWIEAYEPIDVEGAHVVVVQRGADVQAMWRSQQLNLAIDAKEHLAALFSQDLKRVHVGVWSPGLYLTCLFHAGRLCEHTLIRLRNAVERGATASELERIVREHPFFMDGPVPGQAALVERHGAGAQA